MARSDANDTEMNVTYGVDTYECDKELNWLDGDNAQIKEIGSIYRVCFAPNQATLDAGIKIEKLESWEWSTSPDVSFKPISDGESIPHLSSFSCIREGNLCFFDSILTSAFYKNPATVEGVGEAVLTNGAGKVTVKYDLFKVRFKIHLDDALQKVVDKMETEAETAGSDGTVSEVAASADDMSDEL